MVSNAQNVCVENDTIAIDTLLTGVFTASNSITTNAYISDSSNVVLTAPGSINLLPGFQTGSGATLSILNAGCAIFNSLNENVIVVSSSNNLGLVYLSADTIIFMDTVALPGNIQPGSILVSGSTINAPLGYLREILNIDTISNQIILTTSNASMGEALEVVDFAYQTDLFDPNFPLQNNVAEQKSLLSNFTFNLPNFPVSPELTLTGSISIDPELVFEVTKFTGLTEPVNFRIGTAGTINYNVGVEYSPTGSSNIMEEIELYQYQFTPITACIPLPPPVLCFPVVIVPELELKLILQLNGPTIELNYENSGEYQAVLRKIGDNWISEYDNGITFSGGITEVSAGILSGAIKIRAELDFDLYDQEYFEAYVFSELESAVTVGISNCTIDFNLNTGGGLELDILEDVGFDDDAVELVYPINIGTLNFPHTNIVDGDGNIYTSVIIGTQEWLVENLRTTKYNNGVDILHAPSNANWQTAGNNSTPAYCWYNNNQAAYEIPYGAMYNWFTVQNGNLCPVGWHVPNDTEWTTLKNYLGGSPAGGAMKEAGTTHWNSPNTGATNSSGFTALPGGRRESDGQFFVLGMGGSYWSITPTGTSAKYWFMNYVESTLWNLQHPKKYGFSVRCIKN